MEDRRKFLSDNWQYQIRIGLDNRLSELARQNPEHPSLEPLTDILKKHNATLVCQFDAFANYVAEAEQFGEGKYPLYAWTKETIEDPAKKAKYIKAFTLHIEGDEVYAKSKADALEADLQSMTDSKFIVQMSKHDTNPANNPQPPAR